MVPCTKRQDQGKLEKQLFIVGLAAPVIFLVIYAVYKWVLFPLWPFKGCLWDIFWGIYCPGCGGTRALESLIRGEILNAFRYHPIVPYSAVLYCAYMISHGLSYVTGGKVRGLRFRNWYLYTAVLIILVNCLIRNILRIRFDILI